MSQPVTPNGNKTPMRRRDESKPKSRVPPWAKVLRLVRAAMLPVAFAWLVYFAWHARNVLSDILQSAVIGCLALAVVLWVTAHFVSPLLSMLVLEQRNLTPTYAMAFDIHVRNIPARYIPGGIWHTVGRIADFHERGLSAQRLTAFTYLENALAASVTLGVGGAYLLAVRGWDEWGMLGALGAMSGAGGLVFSRFIVNRWILKEDRGISRARYLECIAVMMLFWTVAAGAFTAYVYAFPEWAVGLDRLHVAATYLFSWGIGFMAVFAPQGIGVFEASFAGILAGSLALSAITILVAGFRVVVLCADTLVWLVARASRL